MSETNEQRILAIGAHPDDIEFGCGGILLGEVAKGARIQMLVCSKGEAGSNGTPEIRESESKASAEKLGAKLVFADCGGDAKIESTRVNALIVARVIREFRPHTVLAPSLEGNQHPDHCSVGEMARMGARLARYGGLSELKSFGDSHAIEALYYYAITPSAEPKGGVPLVMDVSGKVEEWTALMECHASQMKTRRYSELQLARARVWGLQAGVEYAQAVWPSDPIVVDSLNSALGGMRFF